MSRLWDDELKRIRQEYEDEGYNKEEANSMAINENIKSIRKQLYDDYANLIEFWMSLTSESSLHHNIMNKVKELYHTEDLSWKDAAQQAIKQYKPLLNTYVIPEHDEERDEDDSTDEKDGEETDNEVGDLL